MWFTFVTARLFIFLSFQPRLAATLLRSCSVVNSPTRRVGLAPTFKPASLAQAPLPPDCSASLLPAASHPAGPSTAGSHATSAPAAIEPAPGLRRHHS